MIDPELLKKAMKLEKEKNKITKKIKELFDRYIEIDKQIKEIQERLGIMEIWNKEYKND